MKERKLFFTGDAIKTELLVVMLEKHGIEAEEEYVNDPPAEDEDEFSRRTRVWVPVEEYDRAWQLFYAEKEGEI